MAHSEREKHREREADTRALNEPKPTVFGDIEKYLDFYVIEMPVSKMRVYECY